MIADNPQTGQGAWVWIRYRSLFYGRESGVVSPPMNIKRAVVPLSSSAGKSDEE